MSSADMMLRRRQAIDRFASLPSAFAASGRFGDIEIPAADALLAGEPLPVVSAVCDRLARDVPGQPGAALVTGLVAACGPGIAALRAMHDRLFALVWERFRRGNALAGDYRSKSKVLSDGFIPEADYGSRWSFKPLHADRSAALFSHQYGPGAGFSGGEVVLVDARAFLASHALGFDATFEWSGEHPESKPVLRDQFASDAVSGWGRNLGQLTADSILFVNNLPEAGVLHGATPVRVLDEETFVRQYHRWSASERSAKAASC